MQRLSRSVSGLLVFLAACGFGTLVNAEPDAGDCAQLDDDRGRLACYDRLSGRAAKAGSSPVAPPPASLAADLPASSAPTRAGASEVARAAPAPLVAPPAAPAANFGLESRQDLAALPRLQAAVRSVQDSSHPGRWVVTLDNGQVWEQRENTAAHRRPRPGDAVTIEEAILGSYLMTTAGRGSSRVRRVR